MCCHGRWHYSGVTYIQKKREEGGDSFLDALMHGDVLSPQFPTPLPASLLLRPSGQKHYMCNTYSDQFCHPQMKPSTLFLHCDTLYCYCGTCECVSEKYSCNIRLMFFTHCCPTFLPCPHPTSQKLGCNVLPSCVPGRICLNLLDASLKLLAHMIC